jgi:hypothetical protein
MYVSLRPRPCYRQPSSTITGLHNVSFRKNLRTTSVCSFYLRLSLYLGGCVRLVNDSPTADLYTCYVTDYNVSLYATYGAVYFNGIVSSTCSSLGGCRVHSDRDFLRPFKKLLGISERQIPSLTLTLR